MRGPGPPSTFAHRRSYVRFALTRFLVSINSIQVSELPPKSHTLRLCLCSTAGGGDAQRLLRCNIVGQEPVPERKLGHVQRVVMTSALHVLTIRITEYAYVGV